MLASAKMEVNFAMGFTVFTFPLAQQRRLGTTTPEAGRIWLRVECQA
jgi:hypothetical protein